MLKVLLALGLLPAAALAQVAGHGGIPTAGPAAQERGRPRRDQDPVVARIDRIRADLADVARRYRKAKEEERPALANHLVPVLEEIASLMARIEAGSAQGGLR